MPELETVRRPAPENGVERLFPRNAADAWLFKVKDGVERVRFGDVGWRIGYARDAINSYFVFKTLREQGALRKHLRFQVSLASVNSALPPRIFPNVGGWRQSPSGLHRCARRRGRQHRQAHPQRRSRDPMGLLDRGAGRLWRGAGLFRRRRDRAQHRAVPHARRRASRNASSSAITSASARSAAGRALRRADLSATVDLANATIEASGRRVDWVHIPVLPDVEEVLLRAAEGSRAARRARLSRRHPSHGRLQGAHRAGAEIPAGIRVCGLLRLRPHPAGRDAGWCSTSIFRRSRPPVRARIRRRPVSPNRRSTRAPLRPRPHPRHRPRSPRRRRVEANKQSAWHGCARHGQRRRPRPLSSL